MMRKLLLGASLGLAVPAAAQTAPASPPSPAAAPAPTPPVPAEGTVAKSKMMRMTTEEIMMPEKAMAEKKKRRTPR